MIEKFGIYFAYADRGPYLLLIPVLIFLMIKTASFRRDILKKLGGIIGSEGSDSKLRDGMISPRLRGFKHFLFISGLLALSLSVLGPQWGQKAQVVKAQGLDICFAMDLSKSMLAEDASPSRLEQAKNQLSIFLPSLGGDRAALVGFAGTGFVAAPLSSDHSALAGFLDPLNPDFISDQSTNVASGVDACLTALSLDEVTDRNDISDLAAKLIVLISDGEDQLEDYNEAIQRCEKLGVPVYAMAAGTVKGGKIPVRDDRRNIVQYLTDSDGKAVVSSLKEKALKEIASKTGGQTFYLSSGVEAWKQFSEAISNYKRDSKDAGTKLDREDRFQWPLALAIFLLMLDFLLPEAGFTNRKKMPSDSASTFVVLVVTFGLLNSNSAFAQETNPLFLEKNERNPSLVLDNKIGLYQFKKAQLGAAVKKFEEGIEKDSADYILRFNWATTRLLGSLNKEGNANPKIVDESIREFETLKAEIQKPSAPANQTHRKKESDDLLKALTYQLGQAYELKRDIPKALIAYYQTLETGRQNAGQLDTQAKKNIERLITQASSGSGGGGDDQSKDGEGGEGKDPSKDGSGKNESKNEEPKKDGDDHKDKKQKPKYSGTEISEEEAKQILESVSGEERDVQKRKAQGEARERSKRDSKEKGVGSGSENQW
jgi:Ca-activated chloride channel family protein